MRKLLVLAAIVVLMTLQAAPAYAVDGYQETVQGVPPAAAQDPCQEGQSLRTGWGLVCFYDNGDDFLVIDSESDGQSVGVQWKFFDGSRSGLLRDKLGFGVNSWRDKDFPEQAMFKMRMGRCNQTPSVNCQSSSHYSWYGLTLCMSGSAYLDHPGFDGGYACTW